MIVDTVFFMLIFGMPIILSFCNKNPRSYISYIRTGEGDLPISKFGLTQKKLRKGLVMSLLFAYLKHLFLHVIVYFLPIIVVSLIMSIFYTETGNVYDDSFYLERENYSSLYDFLFLVIILILNWIPLFTLLKKSSKWMRWYYYIISFFYDCFILMIFLLIQLD